MTFPDLSRPAHDRFSRPPLEEDMKQIIKLDLPWLEAFQVRFKQRRRSCNNPSVRSIAGEVKSGQAYLAGDTNG